MVLEKLFEDNQYQSILDKKDALKKRILIEYFYDNEIPDELIDIYISQLEDELFIILNGCQKNISDLCEKWDEKIRTFMVFGSEDTELLKKLKYNTIQIVIYDDELIDRSEEGSTRISRKILLPGKVINKSTVEIEEEEKIELPFVMINSDEIFDQSKQIEKLRQYLPDTQDDLEYLYKSRKKERRIKSNEIVKKNFSKKEFETIRKWVLNDDNRED